MRKHAVTVLTAVLLAFAGMARAGTVQIALSPVGDAGNVADFRTGFGAVPYDYSIGTYDVTMGQYAAFLDAVAATSTMVSPMRPTTAPSA